MTKTKEKNYGDSNWAWIFCIALFGGLVASITMYELMTGYNTPENTPYPNTIDYLDCICNSLNAVIVDIRVSEINYTYTCWIEAGDKLKNKLRNAGENKYEFQTLKINSHMQSQSRWRYKETIFNQREYDLKYDSNIYTTPYFDDYIETMLKLDNDNYDFTMICEATPITQNIEYTVWDEGYKDTHNVQIELPHYKIICNPEDTSCKNKCDIINSCDIIFNDGKWLGDEQGFARTTNQIIRDTVKIDIEGWYR